jgi:ribonuclease BN (tRNA processing enzyme)
VRVEGLEKGNPTGHTANVHEIKAGSSVELAGVKVTAFAVHHGSWPEAFGYRLDAPDRRIVISGDCAPSPGVIEACDGCDVLLHEVYSLKDEAQQAPGWRKYLAEFHTSTAELAQIATKARPKLVVLYHQLYEKGATDAELLAEIRARYRGQVVSAKDLDIF